MKANFTYGRQAAVAFGIATLLGILPVRAADVVMEEPPAPLPVEEVPIAAWTGPYVGGVLGYGFSSETNAPGNSIDTDGFLGGVFGGYQGQEGMFVYGVEGDVTYSGVEGSNAGLDSESGFGGTLRARLGVAATDRVLIYGTAGGAAQRLEVSDGGASDTNTMLGWTAGVGADVKLTDRVFARGEYRYTDFSSEDFDLSTGSTPVDAKENKVMFGLGMKF